MTKLKIDLNFKIQRLDGTDYLDLGPRLALTWL
jgi:hypothetical protein